MAFKLWEIECLLIESGYREHISSGGNWVRIAPSIFHLPSKYERERIVKVDFLQSGKNIESITLAAFS